MHTVWRSSFKNILQKFFLNIFWFSEWHCFRKKKLIFYIESDCGWYQTIELMTVTYVNFNYNLHIIFYPTYKSLTNETNKFDDKLRKEIERNELYKQNLFSDSLIRKINNTSVVSTHQYLYIQNKHSIDTTNDFFFNFLCDSQFTVW